MNTRSIVNRLIGSAAFIAVVAMTNGCSMFSSSTPATTAAATATDASGATKTTLARNPAEIGFEGDPGETPAPAAVNVFGELGGVERGPVRTVADAGFQQHTFADEGYDSDVAVDPTGKFLAFSSTRHSEHPAIYLQRVDGSSVIKLTGGDGDDSFPTFSPDGKQIAFASTRAGAWNIFVMDVEGRNITQVTSGVQQAVHPSYSPDGSRLVYASLGQRSNQWELWLVSLATGEKRMIGYGLFPAWSPDTSVDRIAFQRARQRGSHWFSLWTLDLIDGEARKVTEVAVSANAAIVSPTWSPDGKRLAFGTILDPNKPGSGRNRGQQDVWTVNADGSNRRRLTDGNGLNLSPAWAVDNRVYFITDRSGTECVWSARSDNNASLFTASAAKRPSPAIKVEPTEPAAAAVNTAHVQQDEDKAVDKIVEGILDKRETPKANEAVGATDAGEVSH